MADSASPTLPTLKLHSFIRKVEMGTFFNERSGHIMINKSLYQIVTDLFLLSSYLITFNVLLTSTLGNYVQNSNLKFEFHFSGK